MSDIKPAQSIGFLCGVTAAGFTFHGLYLFREREIAAAAAGAEIGGWMMEAYRAIGMAHYFPQIFEPVRNFALVHWGASYLLGPLLVMLVVVGVVTWALNLLFEKPTISLLEDPEYEALHKGVKTPKINHMDPIMAVLPPRDRRTLVRDIALGVITPFTPELVGSDIADRPASLLNEEI